MNRQQYLIHSLRYHWKSYALLLMALAVSTAVMVGAMLVGHSMKKSLESSKELRLGKVQRSLFAGDRFLTEDLVLRLQKEHDSNFVGLIQLPGSLKNQKTGKGLPRVMVHAVKDDFWALMAGEKPSKTGGVYINRNLADRLSFGLKDSLLLKMNLDPMGDSVMSQSEMELEALELEIDGILESDQGGDFNLMANQLPPYNLFVPLNQVQELLEKKGRINLILGGDSIPTESLKQSLDRSLSLEDLEFELQKIEGGYELRSPRIFLEKDLNGLEAPKTLFTYLVNSVNKDEQSTPYPLIVGLKDSSLPLSKDEIILSDWMADDLKANVGDSVRIDYYTLSDQNKLLTKASDFKVKSILSTNSQVLDAKMMPDYPGLKDSEHCRDWDVGFELDLTKIRDKDEEYWETHKGRPKAIIALEKSQEMWENRYGDKTALRFFEKDLSKLTESIKSKLRSDFFGLIFFDNLVAAEQALAGSMDFSGLFLGFSFFIFIAILSLLYLLFKFLFEARREDHQLLHALGFPYAFARSQFLKEFLFVSVPGAVIGVLIGFIYTSYLIGQLNGDWQDSIGVWRLEQSTDVTAILIGIIISLVLNLIMLWVSLKHLKKSYLAFGKKETAVLKSHSTWTNGLQWVVYAATLFFGVNLLVQSQSSPKMEFFIFGFLILLSFLFFVHARLSKQSSRKKSVFSRKTFMLSQMGRRRSRSLAVVMMLSCGSFMMMALEVFRMAPDVDTSSKGSGAGGFQLMADFARDLDRDLNLEETQKRFALNQSILQGSRFYAMRKSPGEDASCLNLNRAQRPHLYGIDSDEFEKSERFTFMSVKEGQENPWQWLKQDLGPGKVAVIGDQNALLYSMGSGVGKSIMIQNERGEELELVVVGGVQNSIFQSALLMDQGMLLKHFPSISGFQAMLVESPVEEIEKVKTELNEGLEKLGADVMSTQDVLMSYNEVQNSYISIFQTLGLLGLVLGCSGLCLVVIHNIQDRKDEFLTLSALGQTYKRIKKDLLKEHLWLFTSGLLFGFGSGFLATWPIMSQGAGDLQWATVMVWMLMMLGIGFSSIMFGFRFAMNEKLTTRGVEVA